MPKVNTPDTEARRILFAGSDTYLAQITGTCRQTMARRREEPGTLRLDELAEIVKKEGITAAELYRLVRMRGELMI